MSPQKNPVVEEAKPGHLLLTREYNAPRSLVFTVWTDPKHLAQWWGPHGFTNPRCEWDVRPGGKIHVDMRGPDGTVYPMTGIYREVVSPERLVFAVGALNDQGEQMFEILNTVTFVENGSRTTVTLRTEVLRISDEAKPFLNGHSKGWSQSLERFTSLLETLQKEKNVSSADTSDREIKLSRDFDAPRELVWEALTNPKHVVNWWGPHGFSTTIEEMNVRPGGIWKHVMRGPDGAEYPSKSIFTEVEKPARLVFTQAGGKKGEPGTPGINFVSTWTFDLLAGNKTRVTIHMVFPTAEARDTVVKNYGAIEGGKQTLARLGEHLVTMSSPK